MYDDLGDAFEELGDAYLAMGDQINPDAAESAYFIGAFARTTSLKIWVRDVNRSYATGSDID